MNKRKAKKRLKKCFCPLVDNFGCLSMSDEEREAFEKSVKKYSLQHFSYKHYKDKETALKRAAQHPTIYAPSGAAIQKVKESSRSAEISSVVIFQNIEQLKTVLEGSGMSSSSATRELTALSEQPNNTIVTDPKGELANLNEELEKHGYTILSVPFRK